MSAYSNQGQDSDQSQQYGSYSGYSGNAPDSSGYKPYEGYYQQQQPDQQQQSQQQQQQQYASPSQQQQQQTFYQPPASATARASHASDAFSDATSTGWDPKIEAILSYVLLLVGGLFFLLFERKNRFVRFHAAQSTILMGGATILYLVVKLLTAIPILGGLLGLLLSIPLNIVLAIVGVVAIFAIVMAYRGNTVRIPIIAEYADALLNRFSGKSK